MPSSLQRTTLLAAVLGLLVAAAVLVAPAARADTPPPVAATSPNLLIATDFSDVESCKDDLANDPPTYTLCTGESLEGDRGTWTDEGSLSFLYQFLSCDVDGSGCNVTDEFADDPSGHLLVLGPAQLSRTVRFRVIATGPGGTTIETSPHTNVVTRGPGTRPVLESAPTIDGDPWPAYSGQTINGRIGTWDDPFKDYHYDASWLRCQADGTGCATLSTQRLNGPNDPVQRTLTTSDIGSSLRLEVTAHSISRADSTEKTKVAVSLQTPAIQAGGPPVNLEPPVLLVGSYGVPATPLGKAPVNVGDTLTATAGRWTINDALVVNWLRCARDGTGCVSIPGADAFPGQPARQSYLIPAADTGFSIRADVTATAFLGTATLRTPPARVGADPAGTTTTGTPTTKDRATVRVRKAKVTGSGRTLAVYLSLGAAGKVKLSVKGGGTTLGRVSRTLGKGKVAIALKLSKKARKVVKKSKKIKTRLSLSLRTDTGDKGSVKQSVTLRGASR